jgi:branched-chain amino acid transport system permease protein
MPDEAIEASDKQEVYFRRFDAVVRQRLRALVTDELIAAHLQNPSGPHGDDLERLLNYFRRAAVADKYAILAVKPYAEYRVVALSGRPRVPPRTVDENTYATPSEAQHAVFLRRVQDLMQS